MLKVVGLLITFQFTFFTASAQNDRTFNQIDEYGNVTQRNDNRNFNKNSNDTTKHKEIPKGHYSWTVDRKFGDIIPATPDTMHHLFLNTTFNTGFYGEYNTLGNNYTARQNRIFIDRRESSSFIFTDPYSFFFKQPDEFLFMNTLSPYTCVTYDNCGDKQNGEDRLNAKFAVNANKRLGFGFDLSYDYTRGYYDNHSISHFNGTLFGSYIGDRYQMHILLSTNHQKATENGGITNDEYITHPESFQENYDENEIPTVLSQNWNRNDNQHVFLSHRYNVGFYRKVKMTEEELKARQFAEESKKEKNEEKLKLDRQQLKGPNEKSSVPKGRPTGAAIVGSEPKAKTDSLTMAATDTTRIQVAGQAAIDSLNRAQATQDSIDATMKMEYVPVTSFIHTLEIHNYKRTYLAYKTPKDYYLNSSYYTRGQEYGNDSISDETKHLQIKNTFGIALLEGFNKYMKAGLKGFVTHEHRKYKMPDLIENTDSSYQRSWSENNISVGGLINKTQGKTLHFKAQAEAWVVGEDAGQLKLDFNTDLNFKLFGDTVRLAANAYFHRLNPSFYQRKYHSKYIWWDRDDLSMETRTRIEGLFSYEKTDTRLRVAVEEIQNYTYFGMSYDATTDARTNMTAGIYQETGNINILTAQLHQNFRLGPLNWENIVTYQNASNKEAIPLPAWNIFSNLYLKFRIAKVLDVELGADATYFTKYDAPDFCPMINQFAIQQNSESRVELGGYPFVDVYANLRLKGVRFFIMMGNVLNGKANHMKFLTPHYPVNGSVMHFGVSWPFFN
ncbi:MAG: putative porin [Prevotella sp.]|nr:putative porin [Prevotella sp.]